MSSFNVAAVSQDAGQSFDSVAAMEKGLSPNVEEAADKGAKVVVFPEYGGLTLSKDTTGEKPHIVFGRLQNMMDDYRAAWERLAKKFGVYIVAPSLPVLDRSVFKNRTFFMGPDGGASFQDKLMLTPEEIRWGVMKPGNHNRVFDTKHGPMGISICYDSEFPDQIAAQARQGAELILVPSNTGSAQGNRRVEIGAENQALSHQLIVAKSTAVGISPTSDLLGTNVGTSGVYAPPDGSFPESGILARGSMNKPEVIVAPVGRDIIADVRARGTVNNQADYERQPHIKATIKRVR